MRGAKSTLLCPLATKKRDPEGSRLMKKCIKRLDG